MAVTAEEIIVALEAEGAEEAESQLQRVDDRVNEVKESMGGVAEQLQSFSSKIQGAMKATVAGLAIATAGLLSQVPVVGEVMGGVIAVVQALAFQLDKRLRPVLQPIANWFFEVAGAIAAGDWNRVRELIRSAVETIRNVNWQQLFKRVISAIRSFVADFNLGELLSGVAKGAAAFAGAVAGFMVNAITSIDWADVATTIIGMLASAGAKLTTGMIDLFDSINWSSIGKKFPDWFTTAFEQLTSATFTITSWFVDFINAVNWTRVGTMLRSGIMIAWSAVTSSAAILTGLVTDLFDGVTWSTVGEDVRSGISTAWDAVVSATQTVTSWFVDLIKAADWSKITSVILDELVAGVLGGGGGGRTINTRTGSISITPNQPTPDQINGFPTSPERANLSEFNNVSPRNAGNFSARRRRPMELNMDGRNVTENTGRWRRDETSRRGRDG